MTANITYRLGVGTPPATTTTKGAPLNNTEIDGNFKSILNDIDLKATLASPTFTGVPLAPTAGAAVNTTQIATTAFVLTNSVLKGTAAAAGTFDTSAVTPTGTTRLNYSGSFYPTSINLIGTSDTVTAATHYFVETASDGVVRPKLLSDVKTEIVTTTAVNSAAATTVGIVGTGTWQGTAVALGYGGTGAATQQAAINNLAGATTSGSYLRGSGTNVVMSAIQAADVPVLNQNTTGIATNAANLNGTGTATVSAVATSGYGLWNSAAINYGILMATGVDATYGGRMAAVTASAVQVATADSNSDYNMYFTMSAGTNRGFVFRSAVGTKLFGINPDIIRSAVPVAAPSFNGITVASDAVGTSLALSASAGVSTKVSREDHVHPYPTPANLGTYSKTEIDQLVTGLDVKASVRAATTANTALSGLLTIDGVLLVVADRVLVKNQTNPIENGIWTAAAGAWTRATDADGSGELTPGSYVLVTSGTQANTGWIENTIGAVTPGTTPMTWVQFNGLGHVDAGSGMTKTGNVINVIGTPGNIVTNADNIDLATVTQGSGASFLKITLDTYGRVSGNTAVVATDITGLSGFLSSTAGAASAAAGAVGTGTTVARADHVHPYPSAANIGLGNVTNESKATMFTNPTFTGTASATSFNSITGLSGVAGAVDVSGGAIGTSTNAARADHQHPIPTATMVGLGNVTNESKATMFTNPTFTGTVSGVSATMVGLGNVNNTADVNKSVNYANYAGYITNFTSDPSRGSNTDYNQAGKGQGIFSIAAGGTNGPGGTYLNLINCVNGGDVAFQIAGGYTSDSMWFRGSSGANTGTGWTTWRSVVHSGNIASQSVSYAGSAGSINGYNNPVTTSTANTIAYRDSASDLVARLFRAEFANEATISGAIAYRVNNTSDNYTRYCSDPAAIRAFIGTDAAGTSRPASDVYSWAKAATAPASGATLGDDNSTDRTQYIGMSTVTTGAWLNAYVSSTKFTFNPSTGTASATVFNSTSDERAKENIRPLGYNLATVLQLTGKKFEMKDSGITSIGLIAQEVQKVVPEVVCTTDVETGMLGVNYPALVALLIESIKELNIRIEALENK